MRYYNLNKSNWLYLCDKNSFAAAQMNLNLKNNELEAKVMFKFNFVQKTTETFVSVRLALTHWTGLIQGVS